MIAAGLDRDARRDLFWLLLLTLALIAPGIGLRDPWPADEPRFVLIAQQMLSDGNWWFPQRGAELYADKPPPFFWLLALAERLTGGWRGAFLLPSLVSALVTVGLTWDLARRLWGAETARWAAGALLVCAQFVFHARRAQIDPTLLLLTTLSLYGLLRHLLLGPDWRWFIAGCFAAGLGVITKGVGFLPLLVLLPWGWMRRHAWHGLAIIPGSHTAGRWALGAGAFLLAIGLWLVPMLVQVHGHGGGERLAYAEEILFRQTAERFADAWVHRQPPWYFLEVIAFAWLPLSLAIPALLAPLRRAWRAGDARVWLPLAWAGLVVLFFTLSTGKRDVYILPALPAFALAAAPFLAVVAEARWLRRLAIGVYLLAAAGLIGGGLWAWFGTPDFAARIVAARGLAPADVRPWLLVIAIGLVLLAWLWWSRARPLPRLLLGAQLVLFTGYGLGAYPLLDGASSSRDLMQAARTAAGPDAVIGLVGWREQNLLQAVGPVAEFGFSATPAEQWRRALIWLRTVPEQRVLLSQADHLPDCVIRSDGIDLGRANRRVWWLIDADAVRDCRP